MEMMMDLPGLSKDNEEREWVSTLIKPIQGKIDLLAGKLEKAQQNHAELVKRCAGLEIEVQKGEKLISRFLQIDKQLNELVRCLLGCQMLIVP